MKRSIRLFLFALASVAVAAMVLAGSAGLPGFGNYPGPYGDLVVASAGPDRHVTNVPTSINFDYRGLDTLGEEYILFAAAAALALLLRKEPGDGGKRSRKEPRPPGDIIRWTGLLLFGPLAVFGVYVIIHGAITPGGGFHGGVIFSTVWLVYFISGNNGSFERVLPRKATDLIEAVGAGAYAVIGMIPLLTGQVFLKNVLPLGETGQITAGGTIALINFFVGVEVAAAFMLVYSEFIREIYLE